MVYSREERERGESEWRERGGGGRQRVFNSEFHSNVNELKRLWNHILKHTNNSTDINRAHDCKTSHDIRTRSACWELFMHCLLRIRLNFHSLRSYVLTVCTLQTDLRVLVRRNEHEQMKVINMFNVCVHSARTMQTETRDDANEFSLILPFTLFFHAIISFGCKLIYWFFFAFHLAPVLQRNKKIPQFHHVSARKISILRPTK